MFSLLVTVERSKQLCKRFFEPRLFYFNKALSKRNRNSFNPRLALVMFKLNPFLALAPVANKSLANKFENKHFDDRFWRF